MRKGKVVVSKASSHQTITPLPLLIPSMRPRLQAVGQSTDHRSGLWLVANENFTKYGTTEVDYGSAFGSATASSAHDGAASSNEATSLGEVPVPLSYDPNPMVGEPNIWCVEGQWQIYRDAKMKNDKEKMA
uniref:Integrase core domain containing protein n=1 Tax=Solanum tuberosum TaxID=4113 RepID=M1DEI2_SOLTU